MKALLGSIAAFLALAMLGCSNGGVPQPSPSPSLSATPTAVPSASSAALGGTASANFAVGIEYALPGLAEAYREAGFLHAKPVIEYGVWGNIEPEQGRFEWGPLDYLVNEYQAAGYESLQILLSAESPWASTSTGLLAPNHFPKPEYLDDYAAFVAETVERYDGDGQADAPGLLRGVHEWGIEREFTGFWAGSAEDYVRLLRIASPAIKQANPEAEVLLVALLMIDAFDDGPNTTEATQRLRVNVGFRKTLDEIRTVLAACDAYDAVDFHSLGDYVEIPATAAWIREELGTLGCSEKPIVVGDAFPMSVLIGYDIRPFHPVTEETRDAARALLISAANDKDAQYAQSVAWLRAETAKGAVRKVIASAGAGIAGINLGNQEDWKTGIPTVDSLAVNGLGSSIFLGLLDTSTTARAPGGKLPYQGEQFSRARTAEGERPAFAALRLTLEKIEGWTAVEKLESAPGAWVYRFETPRGSLWVAWYDDQRLVLPGDPEPQLALEVPVGAGSARITTIPSAGTEPHVTTLATDAGILRMTLGGTPVFIEPS